MIHTDCIVILVVLGVTAFVLAYRLDRQREHNCMLLLAFLHTGAQLRRAQRSCHLYADLATAPVAPVVHTHRGRLHSLRQIKGGGPDNTADTAKPREAA